MEDFDRRLLDPRRRTNRLLADAGESFGRVWAEEKASRHLLHRIEEHAKDWLEEINRSPSKQYNDGELLAFQILGRGDSRTLARDFWREVVGDELTDLAEPPHGELAFIEAFVKAACEVQEYASF